MVSISNGGDSSNDFVIAMFLASSLTTGGITGVWANAGSMVVGEAAGYCTSS